MNHYRLNAYHIMWLFVFFDLPTETARERKDYSLFRKQLLHFGFTMMQYSVYTRHCASDESAQAQIHRIQKIIPPLGQISLLKITDKQYGNILNYWGKKSSPLPAGPQQLELF